MSGQASDGNDAGFTISYETRSILMQNILCNYGCSNWRDVERSEASEISVDLNKIVLESWAIRSWVSRLKVYGGCKSFIMVLFSLWTVHVGKEGADRKMTLIVVIKIFLDQLLGSGAERNALNPVRPCFLLLCDHDEKSKET